jgi:hypothetical protein
MEKTMDIKSEIYENVTAYHKDMTKEKMDKYTLEELLAWIHPSDRSVFREKIEESKNENQE